MADARSSDDNADIAAQCCGGCGWLDGYPKQCWVDQMLDN